MVGMESEGAEILPLLHPEAFLPLLLALMMTIPIWHFLVPRSLLKLQIAFETGPDEYEVHRITETQEDARSLLSVPGSTFGIVMYLMAVTGVLALAMDILLSPSIFYAHSLMILGILLGIPILMSPLSALSAQITGAAGVRKSSRSRNRFIRIFTGFFLLGLIVGLSTTVYEFLTYRGWESTQIYAWSVVVLLFPAILAYGRIMGSGWNALIQSKYNRARGRASTVNPDSPNAIGQFIATFVYVNALIMPITAINGMISYFIQYNGSFGDMFTHSTVVSERIPEFAEERLMGEGGVLGFFMIEGIARIPELPVDWVRPTMAAVVVLFLILNVTIMGIAFVYEVARLMFLGVAEIGGRGGFSIAEPRVLRSERHQQGQVLNFCFSGFAGYTVLLLVVAMFSKFGSFLPSPTSCSDLIGSSRFSSQALSLCPDITESTFEELTWTLAVVGQFIFFLFWFISLPKGKVLRRAHFDLNAAKVRQASLVARQGGRSAKTLMGRLVDDDHGYVRKKIYKLRNSDDARDRLERTRAEMLLAAAQGMWSVAEERATSALAQQGGSDNTARKILGACALAQRDAHECTMRLSDLPQSDVEGLMMRWLASIFDPNVGSEFDTNLLPSILVTPAGRRIRDLLTRYPTWDPWSKDNERRDSVFDRRALLSDLALLRLTKQSQRALDLLQEAMGTLDEKDVVWPRGRVAEALLLLDVGRTPESVKILHALQRTHDEHPAVHGLHAILAERGLVAVNVEQRQQWMPEVMLSVPEPSRIEWGEMIDQMPTNPIAALRLGRRGEDESLAANVWIASGSASHKGIHVTFNRLMDAWHIFGLMLAAVCVILTIATPSVPLSMPGMIIAGYVGLSMFRTRRLKRVGHRNLPGMRRLARRLRVAHAMPSTHTLPPGTHLLLTGALISVEGIPIDVGFPAWLDPQEIVRKGLLPGVEMPTMSRRRLRKHLALVRRRGPETNTPAAIRISLEQRRASRRRRGELRAKGAVNEATGASKANSLPMSEQRLSNRIGSHASIKGVGKNLPSPSVKENYSGYRI